MSAQPRPPREKGRFAYIDGLRGIAALAVCFFHFYSALSESGQRKLVVEPLHSILLHGDLGVQIFFVVSGFVIAHTVRSALITPGFVGRFALRRSLRLDPPYWIAILASYVLLRMIGSERGSRIDAWAYVANMLYLDNLLGVTSIVSVGWTLCLEVQFYLLFVLLRGLEQRLGRHLSSSLARIVAFLPCLVASVVFGCSAWTFPFPGTFVPYWYLFLLGSLALWSLDDKRALASFVGLTLVLLAFQALRTNLASLVGTITAASIIFVGRAGRFGSVLGGRAIQYFGRISYSLYLVHPILGNRALRFAISRYHERATGFGALLLFGGALLISIAAAHLMHRYVERPSIEWSRRWASRTLAEPAAVAKPG